MYSLQGRHRKLDMLFNCKKGAGFLVFLINYLVKFAQYLVAFKL